MIIDWYHEVQLNTVCAAPRKSGHFVQGIFSNKKFARINTREIQELGKAFANVSPLLPRYLTARIFWGQACIIIWTIWHTQEQYHIPCCLRAIPRIIRDSWTISYSRISHIVPVRAAGQYGIAGQYRISHVVSTRSCRQYGIADNM